MDNLTGLEHAQLLAETWISSSGKDILVVINLRFFLQKVESAALFGQPGNHGAVQFIGMILRGRQQEHSQPCMCWNRNSRRQLKDSPFLNCYLQRFHRAKLSRKRAMPRRNYRIESQLLNRLGAKIGLSLLRIALFAILVSVVIEAKTAAALEVRQWPRFRGPNGCGIGEGQGYPIDFGPKTNLAWRGDSPAGSSSPVVHAERIFLTGYAENRRLVDCFDLRTGRRLWERSVDAVRSEKKS